MQTETTGLSTSALFRGIARQDLAALLLCLSAEKRTYEKGSFVFWEGQAARHVGIVASGAVHVLREDYRGNRTLLSSIGPGELFGEAFACAGTQSLPVSVMAATQTEVLLVDCRKIMCTCPSTCVFHQRVIENLLSILAQKSVAQNERLGILSQRTTREKVLAYLAEQAQKAGSSRFTIPFSRQELADYLCVERSAMSAELSRMRHDGLIEVNKREFCLLFWQEDRHFAGLGPEPS